MCRTRIADEAKERAAAAGKAAGAKGKETKGGGKGKDQPAPQTAAAPPAQVRGHHAADGDDDAQPNEDDPVLRSAGRRTRRHVKRWYTQMKD